MEGAILACSQPLYSLRCEPAVIVHSASGESKIVSLADHFDWVGKISTALRRKSRWGLRIASAKRITRQAGGWFTDSAKIAVFL